MAAKGGGAWKVAYADFVTAMMAFFMVMWLCAQNQEVKRAVSDYFSDPLGTMDGDGKKSTRTGSLTEHPTAGKIPLQDKVALGQGRHSHSGLRFSSPATRLVHEWVHREDDANRYWKKQASDQLEAARWVKEVKEKRTTSTQVAVARLARQMKEEIVREAPKNAEGVYRALLLDAFDEVNWTQLAEDLIGQ